VHSGNINTFIQIGADNLAALARKAPIHNPTFTGTDGGLSKQMVQLGNVDNTSDLAKPISTAIQTALDSKYFQADANIFRTYIYAPGTDVTKIRLKVGMVFQKPNPFPSMTIGENVLSGLKLAQLKRSNTDELLESCLVRAGLWSEVKDRLGEHGGALSGGQQHRLCIARSLAVEPQVLLMDEPCSALDPGSTFRIEETISELAKSMTIIIVTHNMQQAARVSDYTAFFLSDGGPGVMVEAAPTSKIFSSPQDKRTEDYVTGRFG
jgi:ABC-type phosphate transport system ATPase subunit